MAKRTAAAKLSDPDRPESVIVGSGNVFADLGLPNPDLALAKAELVLQIRDRIADRKLNQSEAATVLGIDQPKVSKLVRGAVGGYTLDRLFRFLAALDQQVVISVRPAVQKGRRGPTVVVAPR